MSDYILQMKNISKSFPGVKALDNVSLNIRPGTVHALMGENGAGKSTLMKCLFGIYAKDSGEVIFNGEKVDIKNTHDALGRGIAMVQQEQQPILDRSIAENIFCGRYPLKSIGPIKIVDHAKMYSDTEALLKEVNMNFNPKMKLSELSVSNMQSVEIAKAVSVNAKVVIMDEPTSSLTENEVAGLFDIINKLRANGVSIIYISHKMEEILKISDEVTIMRDGTYVGTWPSNELTTDLIIKRMVGRELTNRFPPRDNIPSDVVLEVRDFTSINPKSFKDVNFDVKKGEILGIGGLVGAQRTELMEAIFGVRHVISGSLKYKGEPLKIKRPRDAIKKGIALLTEDRRASGIFGVLSISDNVGVASLDKYIDMGFVLNNHKLDDLVNDNIRKMSIKTPSTKTQIKSLSGGNQQKVIIGRWLANNPDILILDEPTRGIDVGAKYEIYTIIADLAKQGKSIIMISSEMPELLGMSDRVMVMCEGRVTGILDSSEATQEKVMNLATKYM
ncbi:MAG: sugar ABC transporter ATP-binding protein [Anaerorhabdus sp.]|uniref:sugar ABC transporter ATP-binding protein n=2 Tax=Anaerorhabdus sp. TaxID=1872524 RepID=UPI002FCA1A03